VPNIFVSIFLPREPSDDSGTAVLVRRAAGYCVESPRRPWRSFVTAEFPLSTVRPMLLVPFPRPLQGDRCLLGGTTPYFCWRRLSCCACRNYKFSLSSKFFTCPKVRYQSCFSALGFFLFPSFGSELGLIAMALATSARSTFLGKTSPLLPVLFVKF